ncbi:ras-related and estrogen-regulated growth inhibitor-like protein [Saccostrea echinata]|uniref:ras-related and estrogen-regulated growth inhibitor-like protein n=1 Tax=Saccostrea echinata TaxID=191078 RepID=UPI002A841288|nr:ras-related and estrogen-regulated growth inhibitor-like protein [Saccostrea echinata]
MPFSSHLDKDPKPEMDDSRLPKGGHHTGKDINIVVIGVKGVGKSALTVRFMTKRFIGDYDSQIEAVYTKQCSLDGKTITVHILDTAWQANGFTIKDDQIVWADAIMMVYSITDKESFEKLKEFADYVIAKKTDSKTVMALIANKSDLVHMSTVTNVEATQFCAEYNCLFFETSASESYNSVTNAYISVCRQVKLTHKKREKISKFMQNPAIKAKLQIRNPIRGLEMKWRSRAPTM